MPNVEKVGRMLPRMAMLRDLTDHSVLDLIITAGPLTRAEISRRSGISKPTITESVRRLEAAGLLRTAGSQNGRPGRVATFFEVAPDAGYVIAVDIGPNILRVAVADIFGTVLFMIEQASETPASGRLAAQLRQQVAEAIGRAARSHRPLRYVVVGVSGPVDPVTGHVLDLPESRFASGEFQPTTALAGLFQAPLLVENDVNLAALAERAHGVAAETDSFVYFFIGDGSGVGLIVNGSLVRGARGLAGEVTYLAVADETTGESSPRYGFGRAISRRGFGDPSAAPDRDVSPSEVSPSEVSPSEVSPSEVARRTFSRAAAGDPSAVAVIERQGRTIGEAAASICAIIDPELIVLGGPIGSHPDLLEIVRRVVSHLTPGNPRVETSTLGEQVVLRGALALALERGRISLLEHV